MQRTDHDDPAGHRASAPAFGHAHDRATGRAPDDATDPADEAAVIEALFRAARHAQANAHAPYSGFPVGAAVLSASGTIYAGANVENAAYPQGWCAEASAIAAMVSAGERHIAAVLTVADGSTLATCCGGCRQKIREFAGPRTPIYTCGPGGLRVTFSLAELLPHSFGPDSLPSHSP